MTRIVLIVFLLIAASSVYADHKGCGDNESSNICGRLCEPTCANRTPNPLTCPRIQCTEVTRACRCNNGYYRDRVTGQCVLPENCSDQTTPPVCGPNEQLGNCGRICEGTCTNPDLTRCAATSCSGSGCQCKEGYLRNEATDLCVLAATCPGTKKSRKCRQTEKCRAGEILAACGRRCEGTCESPRTPEICSRIRCADVGCRCDLGSGFVRDTKTDKCVRIKDCQPECPANSEAKLCGRVCESTCRDPRERLCKIDPSTCTVDCRCLKGYVRDEKTSECVKPEDCC